MIVTELSLVEYYEKIIPRAKKQNYKWIVSVIARHADAKELYQHIEKDWASINDLTYDNVLFVFSLGPSLVNNSFFHIENKENYVGTMCPYVETINEKKVANNKGDFYAYINRAFDIDWKQKHSQAITEFIRKYNIREEELPVLFIWNLEKDCYSVVSLKQNEDIYMFLKQSIMEQENLMYEKQELENMLMNYRQERKYFELYDCLQERACGFNADEREAIQSVLMGKSAYLEKKPQIQDKKIRNDLKKLGQWKKQIFANFLDIPKIEICIKELIKQKTDIECRIDSIWEQIGNKGEIFFAKEYLRITPNIITCVMAICAKLIANETYCGSSENRRNTYIRDMLSQSGYEVRDQTRHGVSAEGKDAGQIDIAVLENGKTRVLIEALNLSCLNKQYIDKHLDKIFGYDVLGNEINIILNYVTVTDYGKFINHYISYMKDRKWQYPLVDLDEKCNEYENLYASIKVIKTTHERNGKNSFLYHICTLIH